MLHFPPRPLRWLFLDLNSYFASVEQQLNPKLRGRPILVTPIASEATCAIAASYEAKKFGIKTGTKVWEARQKCPDIIIVPAQHGRYVEFHEAIIAESYFMAQPHMKLTLNHSLKGEICPSRTMIYFDENYR